jgi:hypothetical protein
MSVGGYGLPVPVVGEYRIEELTALRMESSGSSSRAFGGKAAGDCGRFTFVYQWLLPSTRTWVSSRVVDSTIVCTAALLVYRLPPLASALSQDIRHVLNFYTRQAYRNIGYGRA